MKKSIRLFIFSLAFFALAFSVKSQNAFVQVIHNSPDTAAQTVDVWLNNTRILDDFNFRESSTFLPVTAGVSVDITIQPSTSTDTTSGLFRQSFTLSANTNYVLVASGIISSTGYNPQIPFSLEVFANARQVATVGTNTDVLVHHGSTDASAVDIFESAVLDSRVVDNLTYGGFDGYLSLPTNAYTVQVRDSLNSKILAAYDAPLTTLNAQGAAVTLVASGFLDTTANSNGPSFGLFAATPAGGPMIALSEVPIPSARLQAIHNSADAAASVVDVWLNDSLLIDDFNFRTASPFVDIQAGVDAVLSISGSTSTDTANSVFQTNLNLMADSTYIAVANGIVSATGYSPNQPFGLDVFLGARETANASSTTDVLVNHGSTDAPIVDVFESSVPAGTIVDNIAYGDFQGYLPLITADYTIEVRDSANSKIVAAYDAPLSTLGLSGASVTILASGFLDTAANSGGPSFGLFAATAAGGALVPLPSSTIPTARLQAIHNSADAAASVVDVWLNDSLLIDDFNFRTASPFVDVQAGVDAVLSISGSTSTDTANSVFQTNLNLMADSTYIAVANGIVSATGYTPNQPFGLDVFVGARDTSLVSTETDILVHHGATDAPGVDVVETSVPAGTIVDNLPYTQFTNYLSLDASNDYLIDLFDSTQSTLLESYSVPLNGLNLVGEAITVVASGFVNTTANSNGPNFGLWVALPSGGALVQLPVITNLVEQSIDLSNSIEVFPNPTSNFISLDFRELGDKVESIEIMDISGRVMKNIQPSSLNKQRVDLSDLENGNYFVRFNTDQKPVLKQLVINK